MSNLHNLQGVEVDMTSWSHHVTQTDYVNGQTMETKDRYFCEKIFLDR